MGEKSYLIMLDIDARKRHYHVVKAGRIINFTVQLEINVEGAWKEVVRYDCAHDYAHKDLYDIEGKQSKINLYMNFEDALTFADEDIDENWTIYKQRFLEGGKL
jgi:hypothetical protein